MANNILAKMAVQISANTAEFNKALASTNKGISSFSSSVKNMATGLVSAFSVQQIAQFTIEVSKLAGEFEAVNGAFKRLPNSVALLEDLKKATGGTVSELELMKRAVQASNFDISLKALPRLLEFATLRAQQTGQSVDYLVDSIVTGIGRKSKLILDNLGISAVQLTEALGGASAAASSIGDVADAVGRIAESNLKNMAAFSDNASTRLQKLSADWDNLKVAIGQTVNAAGASGAGSFLDLMIQKLTFNLQALTGNIKAIDQLTLAIGRFNQTKPEGKDFLDQYKLLEEAAKNAGVKLILLTDEATGLQKILIDPRTSFLKGTDDDSKKLIITLDVLKEQLKELNDQYQQTDINDKKKLVNIGNEIIAIDAQIKKLEELRKARDVGKLQIIPGEFEGSTNPEAQNETEANRQKDFEKGISDVQLTEGTLIHLGETSNEVSNTVISNWAKMSQAASDAAGIIGPAIEGAFSGAFSGVQILARATAEIVDLFARQAIAAAIANAAKAGGPFPFASVILATSAAAAMKGLLGRVGAKSYGGGGGGYSGGTYTRASVGNTNYSDTLTFRLQGSDLVAAYDMNVKNNGRRKG